MSIFGAHFYFSSSFCPVPYATEKDKRKIKKVIFLTICVRVCFFVEKLSFQLRLTPSRGGGAGGLTRARTKMQILFCTFRTATREHTHTHTLDQAITAHHPADAWACKARVCVWVGRWHSICVTLGAAGCTFSSPFSTRQREMAGRTSKGKMVDPCLTQNRHGGNSRTIKGWDGSLYVRSLSFFHLPSPSSFLQCQISQMLCVRAFPLLPEMVMENGKGCASADGSCVAGDLDAYHHTRFRFLPLPSPTPARVGGSCCSKDSVLEGAGKVSFYSQKRVFATFLDWILSFLF